MMIEKIQRLGVIGKGGAWFIILHMLFLPSLVAFSSQGTCLTLKTAVVVDQDALCLQDIATLSGGPETKLAELGAIPVSRSPQPGRTRFVSSDYIRIRLKKAGVDIKTLTFKGPEDVRITRKSAELPVQDLRQAVENAIRSRMPWKNEDVAISGISFDEAINLPTGKLAFRIEPGRNEDYLGRTILALHLFVDGKPVRKIWVHATIGVMANVVTVIRPLGKHQTIERNDLSVERRDLADLPSTTVSRIEDAVGNRAARMVYPNTVLQTNMISLPPLVKRGDIVKIVANTGIMTITATGLVRQKGCRGEMVRVMNTDSNRIVTARVTGPGAVEVDF